jgi:trehalose/maltose hydrolase-like predicted phosphorylase
VTSASNTSQSRTRLIRAGRDYVLLPRRRDGVRATEQHAIQAQVLAWAPGWNAGVASVVSVKTAVCTAGAGSARTRGSLLSRRCLYMVMPGDQGRKRCASAIHIKGAGILRLAQALPSVFRSHSLGLDDAELARWRAVAETMVTGWNSQTGLFEQFAGYFGLEEVDLADYAGRSVPMDVVLGREQIQRSKVIKQADVVALLGLLPEEFPGDSGRANFRYYEPRCGHGSSLSGAMHGLVAARLGDADLALRYFQQATAIDLADNHTTIAGGLHMAALGGTWLTAISGFAGASFRNDGIAFHPKLPATWTTLKFGIQWRGRRLTISIDGAEQLFHATLEAGEPMAVFVNDRRQEVGCDRAMVCPLR